MQIAWLFCYYPKYSICFLFITWNLWGKNQSGEELPLKDGLEGQLAGWETGLVDDELGSMEIRVNHSAGMETAHPLVIISVMGPFLCLLPIRGKSPECTTVQIP